MSDDDVILFLNVIPLKMQTFVDIVNDELGRMHVMRCSNTKHNRASSFKKQTVAAFRDLNPTAQLSRVLGESPAIFA